MQRLFFVALAVCLLSAVSFAQSSPPTNNSLSQTTASAVIDSQHTADAWEMVDSVYVNKSDTCNTFYHVSGSVTLQPYERLFVGLFDGAATTPGAADTLQLPDYATSSMSFSFGLSYIDSLRSQTDAADTVYFKAAVGGSATVEKVTITNVRLTGAVVDYDAE